MLSPGKGGVAAFVVATPFVLANVGRMFLAVFRLCTIGRIRLWETVASFSLKMRLPP